MRRIDTMGLQVPRAWKDELYQNELTKIDIKKELLSKDRIMTDEDHDNEFQEGVDYRLRFNFDKFNNTYFDKSLKKSYQNF